MRGKETKDATPAQVGWDGLGRNGKNCKQSDCYVSVVARAGEEEVRRASGAQELTGGVDGLDWNQEPEYSAVLAAQAQENAVAREAG